MHNAQYYVDKLKMNPHPEGGWYIETYRSPETVLKAHLPTRFTGERNYSTAIYFLLESPQFSAFHRMKSDELWHFYAGRPLNVYVIDLSGSLEVMKLGADLDNGETFQTVVKAGCWFASRPAEQNSFSLVACTVAPGFDFADFELAKGEELTKKFPQHKDLIQQLCRI